MPARRAGSDAAVSDVVSRRRVEDRAAGELDDRGDRAELRDRYYGLLQELRIVVPGVLILVAFLMTVPFANRFPQTDATERLLFGIALMGGVLSVVAVMAPIAFHRGGERRSRASRLVWAIRLSRSGLALFAVSLVAALALVERFVFGPAMALACSVVLVGALVGAWLVLPVVGGRPPRA